MKKSILICLILVFVFSTFTFVSAESAMFYTISCNPGEEASNEMRINWHTDLGVNNSYVLYTTKDDTNWEKAVKAETISKVNDAFVQKNASGTKFIQNGAVLSNLLDDTHYMYKITNGIEESDVRYFKTSGGTFSFIWSSDFHAYYDDARRLNNATKNIEEAIKLNGGVDFILNTGDFIAHGGTYKWWKQVSEASWMKNYMFAATLGNHDWMTSAGTNVSHGASNIFFDSFSNYPKNGYSGQENVCYYFYYGDALFVVLNTEEYSQAQYNWCEEVLKNNDAQYIFLVQHYQAFNGSGSFGSSGYTRWNKLCDKYGVDIFFTGNSHVYVRSKPLYEGKVVEAGQGTVYMVAPSSDGDRGVTFNGFSNNKDLLEYGWADGAYTVGCSIVTVGETGVTTKLVNKGGQVLDSAFIKAKRPASDRTTHDLSDFDKEGFESSIRATVNSKDLSRPRIMIPKEAYDVLKAVKISNAETNEEYYFGKTIKNTQLINLENMPKGLLKIKVELFYFDNTVKELNLELENVPKWGKLSNISTTITDDNIIVKWAEGITLDTVKQIDVFVNGTLNQTVELNVKQATIENLEPGKDHTVTLKVKDSDDSYLASYDETFTIKARWAVTFYGFNNEVLATLFVNDGEKLEAIEAKEVEGYKFTGWSETSKLESVKQSLEIYASYEKISTYKVTFVDKDGNEISVVEVLEGEDAKAPTAPSVSGYTFTSWDVDFTNVKSDLTVKALYNENATSTGCTMSASILLSSIMLLGLAFIRRRNF